LAARFSKAAIYEFREFVVAGGLISYGTSLADAYRLSGVYAARLLKGEKPSALPVQQVTRLELIINLKTGKDTFLFVAIAHSRYGNIASIRASQRYRSN
jgi:putative ABC transport system substrate-binding protein